jgi:hypothetical protein
VRISGADDVAEWLNMLGEKSIEFFDRKWKIQNEGDLELIVDVFLVSFDFLFFHLIIIK